MHFTCLAIGYLEEENVEGGGGGLVVCERDMNVSQF